MKRPLVGVALLYCGGVLMAEIARPPLVPLFALALTILAGAICVSRMRVWLLGLLLFVSGWTNAVWRSGTLSPYDLRLTQTEAPVLATLRGELAETPSERVYFRDDQPSWRTLVTLEVSAWRTAGTNWQRGAGRVLVTFPGVLPKQYFDGQTVEVTGVLSPPPRAPAPRLFDYRAYLCRQRVYYQLKTASLDDWQLLTPERQPPLSDRFLVWAQSTLARGLPGEDESLRLVWSMVLGWKTGLTQEVSEPFMQSGTMHIFAISGLHIVLITGVLVQLLRFVRFPRFWCGCLVMPLIWFYTAATGWQPSAIRAAIMMSVIIGGWALARPTDLLNSLAAAAFFILLWDPQQLFGASFQLSFFVVLSIALLLPPLEKLRDQWLRRDPLLPDSVVPLWQRRLATPLRWVTGSVAVSLAAWLGSLPLTASYFHLFSPVTLLANLLIVPLSSIALACATGSLLCGGWLPWAGELFNHSGWFWMEAMLRISRWTVGLPAAYCYVRSPSPVEVVFYYSLLIGLLTGWLLRPNFRRWALAVIALMAIVLISQWHLARRSDSLTVLPFNGGLSLYASLPGRGGDMLLDTGTTNSLQFITAPFLRAQGVNRLHEVVLTHGDVHHVGGAMLLPTLFRVDQACVSPAPSRSPYYRRALQTFETTPKFLRTVSRNERVGPWTVLHPARDDRFARGDDNALVLYAFLQGTRVLLLSDLGAAGQKVLLERSPELRADIIIAGLPSGGSEPLSEDLVAALHPRLIIVGDADYPVSERARPRLCERLGRAGIPVLYTRACGTTTIDFHPREWRVRTMSGESIRRTRSE